MSRQAQQPSLKLKSGQLNSMKNEELILTNTKTGSLDCPRQSISKQQVKLKDNLSSMRQKSVFKKMEGEDHFDIKNYLLTSLYSRKRNYAMALLSFQEHYDEKNQKCKTRYNDYTNLSFNFWSEIKVRFKELFNITKFLPGEDNLNIGLQCYISKCHFMLSKEEKAFSLLEQCEIYTKKQQQNKKQANMGKQKLYNFKSSNNLECSNIIYDNSLTNPNNDIQLSIQNNANNNISFDNSKNGIYQTNISRFDDSCSNKHSFIKLSDQNLINNSSNKQKKLLSANSPDTNCNTRNSYQCGIFSINIFNSSHITNNNQPQKLNLSSDSLAADSFVSIATNKKQQEVYQDNSSQVKKNTHSFSLRNIPLFMKCSAAVQPTFQQGDENFDILNNPSMGNMNDDDNDCESIKLAYVPSSNLNEDFTPEKSLQITDTPASQKGKKKLRNRTFILSPYLQLKNKKMSCVFDKLSLQSGQNSHLEKSRLELSNHLMVNSNIAHSFDQTNLLSKFDESKDVENVFQYKRKQDEKFMKGCFLHNYLTKQSQDVIVKITKCELLFMEQQYLNAAQILTALLEEKDCFMSYFPFRIFDLIRAVLQKFHLKSLEFEQCFRKFNPNINMQVVVIFACKENEMVLKAAQTASNLVSSILTEEKDQFGAILVNQWDGYISSYMSLLRASQVKKVIKHMLQDILKQISNQDIDELYDLLLRMQSILKFEGEFDQQESVDFEESLHKNNNIYSKSEEKRKQYEQQKEDTQKWDQSIPQLTFNNQISDRQNANHIQQRQQNMSKNQWNNMTNNQLHNHNFNSNFDITNQTYNNSNNQSRFDALKPSEMQTSNINLSMDTIKQSHHTQQNTSVINTEPYQKDENNYQLDYSFDAKSKQSPNVNLDANIQSLQSIPAMQTLKPVSIKQMYGFNNSQRTIEMERSSHSLYSIDEEKEMEEAATEAIQKLSNNSLFHLSIRKALNEHFANQIVCSLNMRDAMMKAKKEDLHKISSENLFDSQVNSQQIYIIYCCDYIDIIDNLIFKKLCHILCSINIQILIFSGQKGNNFLEQEANQTYCFSNKDIIRIFYTTSNLTNYMKSCRNKFNRKIYPFVIQYY